eukprot:TRINITY_DN1448_c0_g1_i1.p3 TRINITY_DN1448_c0_g1~~TRINITY_DN1448_c0_g1_i1.p3  ORF type:complete len:453 (-),score=102.12 TRINITY_DN1448_c0_g1_i1:289-1647(-)
MAPSFAMSLLRARDGAMDSHQQSSTDRSASTRQRARVKLSLSMPPLPPLPPLPTMPPLPSMPPLPPIASRRRSQAQAAEREAQFLSESGTRSPIRLLVLAHGLQGTVEDFSYVLETLHSTAAVRSGELLVHASGVNTDKTHDGVDLGGLRLAEDIREVVSKHDSLQSISLVGFSLGGLYVRYAVAHLFDATTGLVAGLQPDKVVMVAAPNLGVRQFGVYRFLQGVVPLANTLLFETARQLFLCDDECLLELMTRDGAASGARFLSSLAAFRSRLLYANVRNDFMVNYGTAALDAGVKELTGAALQRVLAQHAAKAVDSEHDERGCQLSFELQYEPSSHAHERASAELSDGDAVEREMARRLRALGWTVVGVDFPMAAPLAHNRIVAMSRNGVHSWMNAGGRRVVHHLTDALCRTSPQSDALCARHARHASPSAHAPLFRPVRRAATTDAEPQ